MTVNERAFVWSALAALLAAALLHLAVLAGVGRAWMAMVHLTIFGWITLIIIAVNYHMLPVFTARDFPYSSLIWTHWALLTVGVAVTTGGLFFGARTFTVTGLLLQLGAAFVFTLNTILLLLRGKRRAQRFPMPPIDSQPQVDQVGQEATKLAGLCLPVALLLLLLVQLNGLNASWLLAAEHLTVLGWVMVMIMGVGYHVLPRFSGRGVRGAMWARTQLRCHEIALVLLVVALGMGWGLAFAAAGLLMALSIALFAYTIWPTLAAARQSTLLNISFKERV